MLGVAVSSAVCLISGGHTCAPSLITLLCVTPHIVSWSQRQDTFHLPHLPPPLPPAVSAISVEISSLPPGALAASAHRSQRLTRMRIRERLRAALPKPVTPAPTMPPSDTEWSLPDTDTRITGRARLHHKPLAVLASGRLPPLTSDTHCQASHRFRHTEINI